MRRARTTRLSGWAEPLRDRRDLYARTSESARRAARRPVEHVRDPGRGTGHHRDVERGIRVPPRWRDTKPSRTHRIAEPPRRCAGPVPKHQDSGSLAGCAGSANAGCGAADSPKCSAGVESSCMSAPAGGGMGSLAAATPGRTHPSSSRRGAPAGTRSRARPIARRAGVVHCARSRYTIRCCRSAPDSGDCGWMRTRHWVPEGRSQWGTTDPGTPYAVIPARRVPDRLSPAYGTAHLPL